MESRLLLQADSNKPSSALATHCTLWLTLCASARRALSVRSRLHLVVKAAVQALAAGAEAYKAEAAAETQEQSAGDKEAGRQGGDGDDGGGGGRGGWPGPGPLGGLGQLLQRRFSGRDLQSTAGRDAASAPAATTVGGAPPTYAGAMLTCLQAKGRLPQNRPAWGGLACLAGFGLSEDAQAVSEVLGQLKLQVGRNGCKWTDI